ncbi:CDP-diacylglycerol--serine O-phosphatidyltransferase [Helicobacter cappadocius]|uniref:CDP-diacylglycerol--serine O-phosphatidyltransferase n=1 Tax=Helicobacter cappadocius TaxID=3063998 RepID=A0AA90TAT7_9HELI|nr:MULTISPECIES: CDP-diacylglycerol--serine O-phosphatidyltransferase [unclassified Helicobacter]MDO7252324.1 CDP-diacylglycerol--serine O-phosphatidyltransferase [Helicobacter sp. faydin-H75]MDP2538191.1 CDP-diacylglycerol--serine O-phosphatidyltransferase [Helicobacter sp. faydin-H76]
MNINPLYALPNLFTAGSIFLGVMSIMFSSNSDFQLACYFILISMILDGLDGRVARMTHTTSKFGVEFDSLADVVAFGVAPAMLLYFYMGQNYGVNGEGYKIVVSALFVIFGAIRLARFNIGSSENEPNSFVGLPIPSAAVLVILWVLMDIKYDIFAIEYKYILLIIAFVAGILMVSNIRYPSFKKVKWNLKTFVILLILLAIVFANYNRAFIETLSLFMSLYVLYGIFRWIFLIIRMQVKKIFKSV